MNVGELEFIDLKGFIKKLNSEIDDSEGQIELGNFIDKKPRKNPFLYRLMGREAECVGKSPLIQTVEGIGFSGLFDLESEINAGYVFVERGCTDTTSEYGGAYETMRLRIKQPLKLKNGGIIPNCSIKLLIEAEEWVDRYQERRDHIRRYDLYWERTNLSKILPTEWFLYDFLKTK